MQHIKLGKYNQLEVVKTVDFGVGAPERRLLGRSNGNPILFLNQRDDLYVLCD